MRILVAAFILALMSVSGAVAGNCQHSWQTASDGSSCGDRSADSRDGGD